MMFETFLYICRNYKDFNIQFPLIKECSLSLDLIKSLSMSFKIAMSDHPHFHINFMKNKFFEKGMFK